MMQIDNDIFRVIPDHHDEASLLFLHPIAQERLYARVSRVKLEIDTSSGEMKEFTYKALVLIFPSAAFLNLL